MTYIQAFTMKDGTSEKQFYEFLQNELERTMEMLNKRISSMRIQNFIDTNYMTKEQFLNKNWSTFKYEVVNLNNLLIQNFQGILKDFESDMKSLVVKKGV